MENQIFGCKTYRLLEYLVDGCFLLGAEGFMDTRYCKSRLRETEVHIAVLSAFFRNSRKYNFYWRKRFTF